MNLIQRYFISLAVLFTGFSASGQTPKATEKVTIELIPNSVNDTLPPKIVSFDWDHSRGIGGVSSDINALLKSNGVTCPPKRQKLADNIWLCGDGTTIRIKGNGDFAHYLLRIWE